MQHLTSKSPPHPAPGTLPSHQASQFDCDKIDQALACSSTTHNHCIYSLPTSTFPQVTPRLFSPIEFPRFHCCSEAAYAYPAISTVAAVSKSRKATGIRTCPLLLLDFSSPRNARLCDGGPICVCNCRWPAPSSDMDRLIASLTCARMYQIRRGCLKSRGTHRAVLCITYGLLTAGWWLYVQDAYHSSDPIAFPAHLPRVPVVCQPACLQCYRNRRKG